VPHERLMDEARELARRLCQGAPLASRVVKDEVRTSLLDDAF